MTHIGEENGGLDNLAHGGARCLNDSLDVLAALSSLFANSALNESTLGGQGDLARAVDGRGGLDGLGLFEKRNGEKQVSQMLVPPLCGLTQ